MAQNPSQDGATPSELIDAKIAGLNDWRGETLARIRGVIKQAHPGVVETVKWRKPSNPAGVPVWECAGIICTGDAFKGKVKLTFARGAELADPARLFNASLEGNAMRAIDIGEGQAIHEDALSELVHAAAELNAARSRKRAPASRRKPRVT
jgi:hypothetical protein